MNSSEYNAKHQMKEPNGCLQFAILLSLPLSVLVILAVLVVPGCRRETAREEAESNARKDEIQKLMDKARISNQMRESLGLGTSMTPSEKKPGGSKAAEDFRKALGPTLEERERQELLNSEVSVSEVTEFFRTWENELGKGIEAQKAWQQCSSQARANGMLREMRQRDLAGAFIILIDQSLRSGEEVDLTPQASEVFGQELRPPEIMMLTALKALAALESGFKNLELERADVAFVKISKSLNIWERALRMAAEDQSSYTSYSLSKPYYRLPPASSPFDPKDAKAFYQDQFKSYQAHLQHYNAAASKFKESGQKSRMIEAKTAAEEVFRVLARPLLTWRASDDRKIQAKFIKLEGEAVVIEKEDGKQYMVPFSNLAPASVAMGRRLEYVSSSTRTARVPSQ
ncbi:hypothetical protein DES53_11294 [Roseimicrobium gellanilyticum]|uniref:Uncharacterized protein n=1 Tax=Roseimicrobium gellanilyticum TaxID=748857 RepID=A0A366H7R3_9BACT|nr:hypothetical protein [Roseimicrobium gellanilyticum]RBP38096.1 hypothetical protein DES53_11294 [Roseimicrobium gellanilyticum]